MQDRHSCLSFIFRENIVSVSHRLDWQQRPNMKRRCERSRELRSHHLFVNRPAIMALGIAADSLLYTLAKTTNKANRTSDSIRASPRIIMV
jgi:hypothetical protein